MFGLNELIVPTTNRLVDETMRIIKGRPAQSQMAKIQIWFRGKREAPHLYENRIYYLNALIPERFDPNQGIMLPPEIQGLTVFELNDQFVPVRRLDVQRAVYNSPQPPAQTTERPLSRLARIAEFFHSLFLKIVAVFYAPEEQKAPSTRQVGTWTLYDGTVRTLGDQERRTITTFQVRHDYSIPRTFEEFRQDTKDPEDMNYRELRQYIEALTASGYDISKYIVDLRAKFSYPFVSFVMIIIGFPFALKSPRSGAAMGVGLSVFIGFTYWIILQLGISLGHANILPPTLAVWISHIMFISAGFYLILSTRT
jgi:lipopolysaccharide export LptBFGC system permease protein LptF